MSSKNLHPLLLFRYIQVGVIASILLKFIRIGGEDIGGGVGAIIMAAFEPGMTVLIEIDHYHSNVIVNVSPYSFFNFLDIAVSHLPLPRGLIQSGTNQSLRDALQVCH